MKIIIAMLLLVKIMSATNFGYSWDDREIKKQKEIKFIYKEDDNYAYVNNKLFDIYEEDGGLMKVRVLYRTKNVIAILVGTLNNIPSPDIKCESVYAIWYKLHIYYRLDNGLIKLILDDDSLWGHDGDVMCEKRVYLYKTKTSIEKKLKQLKVTDKLILSSIEKFLKPNYAKKYDSKFTFKDSAFNLETLKAILKDIELNKKNLTTYNNIAYYLQKAGANKEAVYLLEKILEKFPKRTVAYYNLGDAYWALGEKKKAVASYKTYIEQMKAKGKAKRIPKVVKERASFK